MQDNDLVRKIQKIMNGEIRENILITQNGMLLMKDRICVSNVDDLTNAIMEESHCFAYTIHSCCTKMYQTIKENYWWLGMKSDINEFVSKCLACQQVKAKHQKITGTLQPLPILEWKWEHITMDFIVDLPRIQTSHDAIWVIVDKLTKSVHFLAIRSTFSHDRLAKLYIDEIIKLHRVSITIVSDWDLRFTSRF